MGGCVLGIESYRFFFHSILTDDWKITQINGTELTNETHAEAVKLLKGTKGACKLVVEPNAESKFLSVSSF